MPTFKRKELEIIERFIEECDREHHFLKSVAPDPMVPMKPIPDYNTFLHNKLDVYKAEVDGS